MSDPSISTGNHVKICIHPDPKDPDPEDPDSSSSETKDSIPAVKSSNFSCEKLCKLIVRMFFMSIAGIIVVAAILAYLSEFFMSFIDYSDINMGKILLVSFVGSLDFTILFFIILNGKNESDYGCTFHILEFTGTLKGALLTIHYLVIKYKFYDQNLEYQLRYLVIKSGIFWSLIGIILIVKLIKWSMS